MEGEKNSNLNAYCFLENALIVFQHMDTKFLPIPPDQKAKFVPSNRIAY